MMKDTDYRQNWDLKQDIGYLEEGIDEENKDFEKCLREFSEFGEECHEEAERPSVAILAQEPFPFRTCTVFFPFTSVSGFVLSKCLQPSFVVPILSHGTC